MTAKQRRNNYNLFVGSFSIYFNNINMTELPFLNNGIDCSHSNCFRFLSLSIQIYSSTVTLKFLTYITDTLLNFLFDFLFYKNITKIIIIIIFKNTRIHRSNIHVDISQLFLYTKLYTVSYTFAYTGLFLGCIRTCIRR